MNRIVIKRTTLVRSPSGACRAERKGSAYLAVIGTTLIVATLAMGSLMSVKAQFRSARGAGDAAEAQLLAVSGIEMARLAISKDVNWRSTYSNPGWQPEQTLSAGKYVSWQVVDAGTGGSVLHAGVHPQGDTAPMRVFGKGRVADAVQIRSVEQTLTKVPFTAMFSALHANGNVTLAAGINRSLTVTDGPLTTNGSFSNWINFAGNVEAQSIINSGSIFGMQTAPAIAKTVPADDVWNIYQPLATTIPWNAAYFWYDSASLQWRPRTNILTPTMSQFATPVTNPNGVYYVAVPASVSRIQFDWVRVSGTILFDCQGTGTTIHLGGRINWAPARADYPMVIIRNAKFAELDAQGTAAQFTLNEGTNNNAAGTANYNPNGFPYGGVSDSDTIDSIESELFGVIHVMGGVGGIPTTTTVCANLCTTGCILAPGPLICPEGSATPVDAALTWDSSLLSNPPLGYYKLSIQPSFGTWRQEILP